MIACGAGIMNWLLPGLSTLPNSHPMFVHFPIAFWFGALLLCCLGLLIPKSSLFSVGRWLLHLGTLSGVVAATSGYFATAAMDHAVPGHELVHVHRNFMIAASVLSVAASIVMCVLRRNSRTVPRLMQVALLSVLAGVTALGADRGAMLVFGYGMGVRTESPPTNAHGGHGDAATTEHDHK